ncbi:site-2 protease family protein [Streptomyces actinomycinicus]|uniref:Site-2 protease family protein n=1 Tax=Streptomyces actinomycinicus TaxID=1695166 RepID=A0A937ELU2_9ACTN|nr:site-2 protease family protein [Streptomyces actinomycinicus]MBL1085236.1 site-2 protease family protein [Streptomyces actinomycinicus]
MDVSGGSGQPRSGNDEPAEHSADPTTPPDPAPADRTADERPTDTTPDGTTETEAEAADQQPDAAGAGAADQQPHAAEAETGAADRHPHVAEAETGAADRHPHVAEAETGAADRHPRATETGAPEQCPQAAGSTPAEHRTLAHSGIAKGEPPQPRPREPGGGILMGRPFGVPVYVAPSWFLVAALITWVFGGQLDRVLPELGAARYLVSLFFAVAFYASVLVHELAHTVAAIRFKLPVRRIQLQFFGGVSEIEKEAETPGREFVLAFVGPLLSLVLAGLFYLAMKPVEPGTVPGVLLAGLMISNLIVAIFNLLPGLPLDGGRMLRAVVWKLTGRPMSGTVAAAWVGRALAVTVLIGLPLLNQSGAIGNGNEDVGGMDTVTDALLAAILAAIIWTGAGNSLRMARLREHLPELRARALTRRAVPVENDTPLSEALRRANAAGARALVVVDADGNPLALVREAAIVGVPEHRRPWVAVSGLAQDLTDGMRVSAELAGEDLLDTLRATPATEYLVVEETGEIYGVLSAADVERAFVKAMARPA